MDKTAYRIEKIAIDKPREEHIQVLTLRKVLDMLIKVNEEFSRYP